MLGSVGAVEELSVEQLDSNHGKDEQKEDINYQDVEHIFERRHNAVEHSLECGNTVDHLEWPKNTEQLD